MESTDMTWRKSTYSSNGGANCVEVSNGNGVLVRDTTDRQGFTLTVTSEAWQAFVTGLK